jgi:type VI secretion system secreted protein VgrG
MLEKEGSLYSNRRYTFSISGLAENTFEVVRFEGEEALSTLYRFDLLLASSDGDIDERTLIRQAAQFSLNDGVDGGQPTLYRGLVRSFAYQYQNSAWTFYRVTLMPKMWLLDTFYLSEVYLDMTRPEIFTTVMNNAGFTSADYSVRFKNENALPSKRDYICQYRESYLTFISRWAERLGIYWWFEENEGNEQIVFSDTRMAHKDEALPLHYQAPGELDAVIGQKRRLQSLEREARSLPKTIVIRDYSAQRASIEITGTAIVDPHGGGEVHIFGEHLKNNEEAAQLAKLRAEGIRSRGDIYSGSSTATGLRCGEFVQVQDHPRKCFNQRYLVTSVRHSGSQAGFLLEGLHLPMDAEASHSADFYLADLTAIPADVQFRPEIRHVWPKIEGTMNAFIDAEGSGQYAELNEKGEYKVQVPFAITQKGAYRGSAWIRQASLYAGSDHGMHFPLHKGTEVLLSFINGDPDQPVITGALYNSVNPNVVKNDNQMQSRIRTAGSNEITLHDEAGKQHMLLKTPTLNTWLRMGSRGSDPTAASSSSSLKAGTGTVNEADGTYNFTGDSADGLTINTDGQFTLTAADNINITSDDDVTITSKSGNIYTSSNNKTTTANGDSSDTTYGNQVEWVIGTKSEGVLGAWQELGTNKNEAYATNIKALGVSISFYGFAFNVYASYINYYNFRLDNAAVRIDNAAVRLKGDAMSLKNVGIGIFQSTTAVKTKLAEFIDNGGIKMEQVQAEIKSETVKLLDSNAEINQKVCEVVSRNAHISENSVHVNDGQMILI